MTVAPTFYGQPPGATQWVSGSACCSLTVKEFEGNTYLLGCHHVFCGSDLSPTLQEIPGTVVEFGPNRVSLAQAAYKGDFPAAHGGPMDAGICRCLRIISEFCRTISIRTESNA